MLKPLVKQALIKTGLYAPVLSAYNYALAYPLNRRNARARRRGAPDGQPIPPEDLIFTVAGSTDVEWFLRGGQLAYETVRRVMSRNGCEGEAVLDFGCGCGRVARHWKSTIHGTDYNPKLIEWCSKNLRGEFAVNGLEPPLRYADDTFDLVYAFSVFTHLTEELGFAWMKELRRIIKPGGYLLISLHGDYYIGKTLNETQSAQFREGKLVVVRPEDDGSNACATYHPANYVRSRMAVGFKLVDFLPEGALGNPKQDVYLLRKV